MVLLILSCIHTITMARFLFVNKCRLAVCLNKVVYLCYHVRYPAHRTSDVLTTEEYNELRQLQLQLDGDTACLPT